MNRPRKPRRILRRPRPRWEPVPTRADRNGDLVVTLVRDDGIPSTEYVAEMVLSAHVGPRPAPGHVARFRDGDRRNCRLENLEWVPADAPGVKAGTTGGEG